MRDGAKLRVRKGAVCIIGENSSINTNDVFTCHERIEIGNDVIMSPNVQIYDLDHDYKAEGGIKAAKYKSSEIKIGNNIWIGANTVILRGTIIEDNCVIGAGSVIKGKIPANSTVIQKRSTEIQGGYQDFIIDSGGRHL